MTTKTISDIMQLAEKNGCCYLANEPLNKHTTFKVGGICPLVVFLNSNQAAAEILFYCSANNVRTLILGNGSNVLCSDNGFDGVTLIIGRDFQNIKLIDESKIEVQAGCTLTQLCNFALQNELTGLEFAYGIPGTVGGAVFMNAGAYDGEISKVIVSAKTVDFAGKISSFSRDEMQLGYRTSIFQSIDCIITEAVFKLQKGNSEAIKARMNELIQKRRDKQPLEFASAGSTFKRPEGNFAGKLIESCGLAGYSVGDAQVSEKHCGFVINRNNASFDDVVTLIKNIQNIVYEKTGYCLECEVRIIGD